MAKGRKVNYRESYMSFLNYYMDYSAKSGRGKTFSLPFDAYKALYQSTAEDMKKGRITKTTNMPRYIASRIVYPVSQKGARNIKKTAKAIVAKETEKIRLDVNLTEAEKSAQIGSIKGKYEKLTTASINELRNQYDSYKDLVEDLGVSDLYEELKGKGMDSYEAKAYISQNIFGSE